MSFLLFTAGGLRGTYLDAQTAAGAFLRVNAVSNERFADTRRTTMLFDVGIILIAEIFNRA